MTTLMGADSLLIISCCATKIAGGSQAAGLVDPLRALVPQQAYADLLHARGKVLSLIRSQQKYESDKYSKNTGIQKGVDVGCAARSGHYLPAVDRYRGTLYSVAGFKNGIRRSKGSAGQPRVLILSALYGPLDPGSPIQDYNLMMSDAPAREWGNAFPSFLEAYVRQNGIRNVRLYLGTATYYYKVAKKAVDRLVALKLIDRAMQYHVINGSTRNTPFQHGLRLVRDVGAAGGVDDSGEIVSVRLAG